MSNNEFYRILVFGPTGAGKSQFCNFVQRDLENIINKVSDSLNSCTQDPQSNFFQRNGINCELIDTAGNNDTDNNDVKNLEKVCEYLHSKEHIHYIILLLNYEDRLQKDTREYIETLGKIFTPKEFYTHLCVIFTHLPEKENKKVKEKKIKNKEEICKILKKTFDIKENERLPKTRVYFINTEIDEDDNEEKKFDEKSQTTVDLMMEQMRLDIKDIAPISTKELDITGKSSKKRKEEDEKKIKELEKLLEQERKRKEEEEKEKKRLEAEIKKRQRDDEERRKKEKELEEIKKRQEEERKRLEAIRREAQRKIEENEAKQKAINELAKKNHIDIQTLDNVMDASLDIAKYESIAAGGGALLWIGGAALTCVCPIAGPLIAAFGLGATMGGGLSASVAGTVAGVSKLIKDYQ